ncbi:MAG: Gfo/Idh/MocA family oxidoreductase, partial [Planctomycetota bacterium]
MSTKPLRIGIIGLDTSHSSAFAKIFNQGALGEALDNCRVVAAVAQGSRELASSVERVPVISRQVKALGMEIVPSIERLLDRVDCVMLESNDGRVHLEQALPVLRRGLPLFVDKPFAASLADVVAIYEAGEQFGTPVFTSSALRYAEGVAAVRSGAVGEVVG